MYGPILYRGPRRPKRAQVANGIGRPRERSRILVVDAEQGLNALCAGNILTAGFSDVDGPRRRVVDPACGIEDVRFVKVRRGHDDSRQRRLTGRCAAGASLDFQAEPRAGVGPIVVGRRLGNAECLGGLGDGQPGEEAELDQPRPARVVPFELGQGLVQGQQVQAWPRAGQLDVG